MPQDTLDPYIAITDIRLSHFFSHLKLCKLLISIYSDYFNTRKGSKEGSDQLRKEGKIEGRVKKCGEKGENERMAQKV